LAKPSQKVAQGGGKVLRCRQFLDRSPSIDFAGRSGRI
jgi:hypothetical protein